MTPEEEAEIVAEAAANPMFLFVKEDENFMPECPSRRLPQGCRRLSKP